MAHAQVMTLIEAAVNAAWTGADVIMPNSRVTQLSSGVIEMLFAEFPYADVTQVGLGPIGARTYREEGAARLVLITESGTGTKTQTAALDTLRLALQGRLLDGDGNLQTLESEPVIDGERADGAGYELSFVLRYRYYYQG